MNYLQKISLSWGLVVGALSLVLPRWVLWLVLLVIGAGIILWPSVQIIIGSLVMAMGIWAVFNSITFTKIHRVD